jgi:D-psicose/D-tagatose/L-ribulose 3-epimerase
VTHDSTLPIGVNTFVWTSPLTDRELPAILRKVASWGFEAVELPLEQPGDWDPEQTGDLLREHRLSSVLCAVFAPGRELTAAAPDVIAQTQAYLRHCIDVAVIQGSRSVVGPMYTSVGRTWRMTAGERASAVEMLRESLRPLVDYAGERGVRLGLEPLNRYETSLINTIEQGLEIVDGLPADAIGLNLDTYHQNIEEKSIGEAIRHTGPRLIHIQLCGNDRGSPGQDHLDWDEIRSALVDVGYSGILGIESFTADNVTIATAASIWRPLAESQDALATRGLEFLRDWRAGWPA